MAFANIYIVVCRDLSYSSFSVLPTNGLKSLETLNVRYNRELTEIPSAKDLPKIRHVEAYYPYHCCQFRKESKSTKKPTEEIPVTNKGSDWVWEFKWLRNDYNDNSTFALSDDLSGFGSGEVDPILARDEGSSEDNIRAAKVELSL